MEESEYIKNLNNIIKELELENQFLKQNKVDNKEVVYLIGGLSFDELKKELKHSPYYINKQALITTSFNSFYNNNFKEKSIKFPKINFEFTKTKKLSDKTISKFYEFFKNELEYVEYSTIKTTIELNYNEPVKICLLEILERAKNKDVIIDFNKREKKKTFFQKLFK